MESFQMSTGRFSEHVQKYKGDIYLNWRVFDMKNSVNLPSKWGFAKDDLNNHAGGITELSTAKTAYSSSSLPLKQKESGINYATHLIMKDKAYYDLNLYISYQPVDPSIFGVAFRYIDPWNFYAVEFRKGDTLGNYIIFYFHLLYALSSIIFYY